MPSKNNSRQTRNSKRQIKNYSLSVLLVCIATIVIVVVVAIVYKNSLKKQIAEPTAAAASYQQYSSAPEMTIDASKQYLATVTMENGGEFVIELYPKKAPITVNSFVFLAREGYFNGITFHRVIADFMAQTGDPSGTGYGGPGYTFVNEDSDLTFDKTGVVAMANAGRDTNGSQFFITFGPQERLNGDYTIFGQVISGMDVITSITLRDPLQNPDYTGDVIASIVITEN